MGKVRHYVFGNSSDGDGSRHAASARRAMAEELGTDGEAGLACVLVGIDAFGHTEGYTSMITCRELDRYAQERYGVVFTKVPEVLAVWPHTGAVKELEAVLSAAKMNLVAYDMVLERFVQNPADSDRELRKEITSREPLGLDLLLVVFSHPEHRINKALVGAGLDLDAASSAVRDLLASQQNGDPAQMVLARAKAEVENPLLAFGRDVTEEAATGAFNDIFPRSDILSQTYRILLRKNKRNLIYTGPAGIGKTANVECLARQIMIGEVPEALRGVKLYEIYMGKLVAGTKFRGEFEARMDAIIQFLLATPRMILFIDEFHLLLGAGRAEGAPMDAANMLKPILAREGTRIIGATTSEEYHRYVRSDMALNRRFDEVRIPEPTGELLWSIVCQQAEGLQKHHGIGIPQNVSRHAISLTDKHLINRTQPDKTVTLLDTACVEAVRSGTPELSLPVLEATIAEQTGLPIGAISGETIQQLQDMENALHARIIGQREAVSKVVATVTYRRLNLGTEDRNMGTFLFVGPTGVGKTALARALADAAFRGQESLCLVDMAEFSAPGSEVKLIGAPASFHGSEKEGRLEAFLHNKSTGVIIFDEIEKAHPDIHTLLLGLLDEGRITTGRGERLDTREFVLILTSNAARPEAFKRRPMGFHQTDSPPNAVELLGEHFPREFLARLDEIVVFNYLSDSDLLDIVKLRLGEAVERLALNNIHLSFDATRLSRFILDGNSQMTLGARELARQLERKVLQPVSIACLRSDISAPKHVTLTDAFYADGSVDVVPHEEI